MGVLRDRMIEEMKPVPSFTTVRLNGEGRLFSPLDLSFCVRPNQARDHHFCGGGVSSAFEIGGVGEPLKIFTLSFQHTLTTCWIHIKLRCHLAALLEFRAQFPIRQSVIAH